MKKLLLFITLCMICACSNKKTDNTEEKVLQEILGPNDCKSTVGWSWNEGSAKATSDVLDENVFTFDVLATGELSFDYKKPSSYSTSPHIMVLINKTSAYDEDFHDSGKYKIGVKKTQTITVSGTSVIISNIKIIGYSDETEPEDPSWSF